VRAKLDIYVFITYAVAMLEQRRLY